MVDVTTLPGASMTALNALLMLACAVAFLLALSSILSVERLKRADLLAGLPVFLSQLDPVRGTPEACRSARRESLFLF